MRRRIITFLLFRVTVLVPYLYVYSFSIKNIPATRTEAIQEFTSEIHKILTVDDPHEFLSFTLKGPRAPRKTKKMSDVQKAQVDQKKEMLRGKIREVQGRLIRMKNKKKGKGKGKHSSSNADAGTDKEEDTLFVQTTVKFHGATDIAQNYNLEDVQMQLLTIFENDLQIENTLTNGADDDGTISEWGKVSNSIQSAECKTVHGAWKLDLDPSDKAQEKGNLCTFVKAKGSQKLSPTKTNGSVSTILSHDQQKNNLISPSAPFLQKLGITDANGKPKVARSSKLRQCQKFVEIVSKLVKDSKIIQKSTGAQPVRVVDMGCGRGYLTFALHSHLAQEYGEEYDIQSRGVDVRPKLMKEVNSIARELGHDFDGLHFMTGTIESTDIEDDIDVLIALHACDTATDDSIWYGMKKNAKSIVVAPCCHKEVRGYLDVHIGKKTNSHHPYMDILRHNIYKERIAETITDSIRALLLEIADYDVSVFEFIGGEHTSKNVMITAVKRSKARSKQQKDELRGRLRSLAELHGLRRQKLADFLGEYLQDPHGNKELIERNRGKRGMPSI